MPRPQKRSTIRETAKYILLALFFCVGAGSYGFVFSLISPSYQRGSELSINQIENSGFEYKTVPDGSSGNLPLYWTKVFFGATSSFGISGGAKHGEQCLFITDNSNDDSAGLYSDPVAVTPGYSYTLRGWGKRDGGSYASIYLRFFAANGTQLLQEGVGVGLDSEWSAESVTLTAPEGAVSARALLYSGLSSTGTCWFDSISLVLADEQVGDGGFSNASAGIEPENWQRYGSGSFSVIDDGGNKILRVSDNSSTLSAGASYYAPATPGTPYRLRANLRQTSGSGGAKIYLSFYDSDRTPLGTYSTGTTSASFVERSIERVAPFGTAYARILCYSTITAEGTADFDDVSFTRNYGAVKYAAPMAMGSGSGDSAANAADYTSGNLWSAVNASAETEPVRVVMLEGDYGRQWFVDRLGNAAHHILIEGETPYAVNYGGSDGNYFIYITDSRNITFRHIHFTAYEDPADLNLPYLEQLDTYDYYGVLRLDGADPNNPTCNIRFEGLSFTHMLLPAWSTTDPHYEHCHDILWDRCSWVTIGYDLYDHSVYCSDGAWNLDFESCFFQDCAGVYLRYRSGSKGHVENCTFISTGNVPTGDHRDRVHWAFIQLFAGVSEFHPDEKLADAYTFKNNSFTYEQTGLRGFLSPYQLYVSGASPSSEPTFHLVPLAEGAVIADTAALTSTRNSLFETYFGINPAVAFDISGNTYAGCWSTLFMMNIVPDPVDVYWTVPPSETESENTDLDKLMGLD